MAGVTLEALALAVLLRLAVTVLMAVIAAQLKALRRAVEAARKQLAAMDWSQMLFNGVQQLREIV